MNFIDELYDLMGIPTTESILSIAQEAEDITSQVADDVASATGMKKQVGSDIDLNVDDIFGTKSTKKNTEDGETEDTDVDNVPGDTNADASGGNLEEEPKEESDDNMDMDQKMTEMSDPFEAAQKKKLWKQFKSLHETFRDSIDLITKYVPNISDAPTIKAMDSIKENLVTGKDLIYRILTDEYEKLKYPEMQKRYIGLNNVYDILTQELDEYFTIRKKDM